MGCLTCLTLAAGTINDETNAATAKIVNSFILSGYSEPGLTPDQCAINVKSAFETISKGSPLIDESKIAAIQMTGEIVSHWIPAVKVETGLTIEQCVKNIYGSSLVILQGSNESQDKVNFSPLACGKIVVSWLQSSPKENLTTEQCMKNILGQMIVILAGSPQVNNTIRAGTTLATGEIVAAWAVSKFKEPTLTIEQCMKNILGSILTKVDNSKRTQQVILSALSSTSLDSVAWLSVRSHFEPPTTEQQVMRFLSAFLA